MNIPIVYTVPIIYFFNLDLASASTVFQSTHAFHFWDARTWYIGTPGHRSITLGAVSISGLHGWLKARGGVSTGVIERQRSLELDLTVASATSMKLFLL